MYMYFKSWLYNSSMLWDKFDEEDKKEEDCCNDCFFNNTRYIQRLNSNHYY